MEPYIIATHRQLSTMHPIHKLLHPHMRYTLAINALARENLLNGGGFVEDFFSPGQYSMELSSAAYKSMWRFDMEALPANLIHRGMAIEDPLMPCGVRLVIEDYPYAADGLLIWSAVKDWVEDYVSHFYSDPNSVTSDCELQAWWAEIKNKGHHDKRNEPWWPELKTKEDLSQTLATMIWTASGQHAALNFGQYPFGGYVPNRPALMRKLIPQKDEPEFENFLLNPHQTFLSSLPTQLQATNVMAAQEILSTHSPDEEYLGQMQQSLPPRWISDGVILKSFRKFSDRLMEIEQIIHARNKDIRLKNRHGAGVAPYELLLPTSRPGETKQATFSAGRLKAVLHNLIPSLASALSSSDDPFQCISEIDKLYNDGVLFKHEGGKRTFDNLLLLTMVKVAVIAGQRLMKYDTPAIISRDRFAWIRDHEFARQMLTGVNPVNIERLKLRKSIFFPVESGVNMRMAVEDSSMPCGIRLMIEDYPYAADGLLLWSAIKDWVEEYVRYYYSDPNSLKTKNDLSHILTIVIWIAPGQHAAINFGQYLFGGYIPNHPALMRKLIPQEDEPDYENFILNPQQTFLSCLPTQLHATKLMAVQDTLSTHSPDEEYLGKRHQSHPHWISDQTILRSFKRFSERWVEMEQIIDARNKDVRLKNRHGAGIPPYELLLPTSGPGVTCRGIPNSISI
ncbi:hypothetical protein ACLOJK_009117 [Asimina triloba]